MSIIQFIFECNELTSTKPSQIFTTLLEYNSNKDITSFYFIINLGNFLIKFDIIFNMFYEQVY